MYLHVFVHGRGNKKSTQASLSMNIIIQSCIYIGADSLCIYNVCASHTFISSIITCFKSRLSFSHLPVRLLLHSTLAVAETLLFAGELLPSGRRQP